MTVRSDADADDVHAATTTRAVPATLFHFSDDGGLTRCAPRLVETQSLPHRLRALGKKSLLP